MNNFSKRNDPKVVSNLSSNHATDIKNQSNNVYKPNSFEKRDSASFHETKVLYQNMANTVPDYTKMKGSTISTPQTEYTEEKELPRPIEDKNRILKVYQKMTFDQLLPFCCQWTLVQVFYHTLALTDFLSVQNNQKHHLKLNFL